MIIINIQIFDSEKMPIAFRTIWKPKTNSNKCCMSNVYMVNLHDNMLVYGCFQ